MPWRRWRFCLRVLQLSWWRRYALARTILPLPVFLNRLAAPRLDFILGMGKLLDDLGGYAGRRCRTSSDSWLMNASRPTAALLPPVRLRGATVCASASLSPTTSM